MTRKLALLFVMAALALPGCKKGQLPFGNKKTKASSSTAVGGALVPAVAAETVPAPPPKPDLTPEPPTLATTAAPATPPKAQIDTSASVMVLCYHNIEDKSGNKSLTITVAQFDSELKTLKDSGFSVIGMQDFLAWRRGEKSIPHKSCVITIDDGWVSGYTNAWPILKKYGYPFTMFIYVNYVGTGGKSLSWEQLGEMRDGGVDIQSHTYSHSNLKIPGGGMDKTHAEMVKKDVAALGVDGWLKKEIIESKKALEKQLGIKVNALAYPFGVYNQKARDLVKEGGYEAAFTVYGQRLTHGGPSDLLGRYAIEAGKPKILHDALAMIGGGVGGAEPVASVAQLASASMVTQPMDNATINNPTPLIKANLATMGEIEGDSVKMLLSGVGPLAAKWDAATKTVSAQVTEKLKPGTYTVILSAKAGGQRAETRWSFTYAPGKAPVSPADAPLPPPTLGR